MFVDASAMVAILTREPEAEADVLAFPAAADVGVVPITAREAKTALTAFARCGKGRSHPAQLNLGDCFAYAVARNDRTSLRFKGDDFAMTDIDPAFPSR
jgi:ribonuclease VapC